MILCYQVSELGRTNIPGRARETAFKALAKKLVLLEGAQPPK
jgi:hypothetical protein